MDNPEHAFDLRYNSLAYLIKTLGIAGKEVIIVSQVPEITSVPINMDIRTLSERIDRSHRKISLFPSFEEHLQNTKNIQDIMVRLEQEENVKIIWPEKILCPNKKCLYKSDTGILYSADDHLSPEGSIFISPLIERALNLN